jgi:hypothetical protein
MIKLLLRCMSPELADFVAEVVNERRRGASGSRRGRSCHSPVGSAGFEATALTPLRNRNAN